jgi:hypothetical protein
MTTHPSQSMFARPRHWLLLGAAQCALSPLALLAAAEVARSWPTGEELRDAPELVTAAQTFVIAAIAYLVSTGIVAWLIGHSVRRGRPPAPAHAAALVVAQTVVLAGCLVALSRGPHSRALLAECETALPAAVVIGLLALALNVLTWCVARTAARTAVSTAPSLRPAIVLQCFAALAIAASLGYLESRPLPHSQRLEADPPPR